MSDAFKEEDEKPLDPAMEKVRRKMVRLLGVSIAVMMVGLMAVLGAIVYKMNRSTSTVAALSADGVVTAGTIMLPKGAYLNGQSLSGDRISLDVTLQGGAREIEIFDMTTQRIIARFSVKAE